MGESGALKKAVGGAAAPAASTPASATAATSAPAAASTTASPRWKTFLTQKFTSKWITGAVAVATLAATAAFGGLESVPAPVTPELTAGEVHVGAQLQMTPQRAVLVDASNRTGVFPEPDTERLLVVIISVTNLDVEPRLSSTPGAVDEIRLEALPELVPGLARTDDGTFSPWLQPGLPVEMSLAWAVPRGLLHDGDEIRLTLPDATKRTGSFLISGTYWDDIRVGAHLTLQVEDEGAGG